MESAFAGSPLEDLAEPLTVLAYGQPGSGKSTGGMKMANRGRVIAINVEGGLKPTALRAQGVNLKNVSIWPPQGKGADYITFDTLETEVFGPIRADLIAAREAGEPDPWYGLVVDSFSELTKRLMDDVVAKAKAKAAIQGKNREQFQIDLADHGTVSQMVRTLLRRFRDLEIHLWITALERRDMDDDSKVKYGPAMGPAIATDTMGLVDVVAYFTVEEIGDETFYIGTTRPNNRRQAKDRFGILPTRMVDADANRMIGYLLGELERGSDPLQARARAAIQREAGVETPAPTPEQATQAPAEEQASAEQEQVAPATEASPEPEDEPEAAQEPEQEPEATEGHEEPSPARTRRTRVGAGT